MYLRRRSRSLSRLSSARRCASLSVGPTAAAAAGEPALPPPEPWSAGTARTAAAASESRAAPSTPSGPARGSPPAPAAGDANACSPPDIVPSELGVTESRSGSGAPDRRASGAVSLVQSSRFSLSRKYSASRFARCAARYLRCRSRIDALRCAIRCSASSSSAGCAQAGAAACTSSGPARAPGSPDAPAAGDTEGCPPGNVPAKLGVTESPPGTVSDCCHSSSRRSSASRFASFARYLRCRSRASAFDCSYLRKSSSRPSRASSASTAAVLPSWMTGRTRTTAFATGVHAPPASPGPLVSPDLPWSGRASPWPRRPMPGTAGCPWTESAARDPDGPPATSAAEVAGVAEAKPARLAAAVDTSAADTSAADTSADIVSRHASSPHSNSSMGGDGRKGRAE